MGTLLSYFATDDLEASIHSLSLNFVAIGSALIIIFVALAVLLVKKYPRAKLPLFLGILVSVLSTTGVIAGGTVYLNMNSYVGGPVHWHADVEVWACGNELELRDPTGFLSNKIGTATLHEHNDKRIHLEGVPIDAKDASLGKFMNVIGGQVTQDTLIVPLNDAGKLFETEHGEEDGDGPGAQAPEQIEPYIKTTDKGKVGEFISGGYCGDEQAEVQTFVYNFDRNTRTYKQTKLDDPANYSISHFGDVPPGDCIVMEFAPFKDRTDKLCKQYGVRDKDKCERFGVTGDGRKICENTEVQ